MPYAQAGDAELYYEIKGSGTPLILIPGFSNGLWIWFRQVSQLSEKFQTIVFDPRGIARSAMISDDALPFTIRSLAADVATLLETIGLKNAHILGASFGGFVAQEFALAYPERTRSLILCCTSFGGPHHVPPALETLQAMASTKGLNTADRIRENLLLAFSPNYLRENSFELDQIIALRAESFVPENIYHQQLIAAMTFNTEARIGEVTAPTLILTGDADTIVPAQNSHNLLARISQAKLKIISHGSHAFFIERADEFNSLVSEFIQLVDAHKK